MKRVAFTALLSLWMLVAGAQTPEPDLARMDTRMDYGTGWIIFGLGTNAAAYILMEGDESAKVSKYIMYGIGTGLIITGTILHISAYKKATRQHRIAISPGQVRYSLTF